MRTVKNRCLLAAGAACLTAVLAGCGSGPEGAKTPFGESTIVFGSHQPLSGPAAPGYSKISQASQAFFDYVNAHGGVYGRTIRLNALNDAYNPTQTLGDVEQLVLFNNVFGIFEGLGAATQSQVVPFLNAYQVPDLFAGSGCPCLDNGAANPYAFGWQPNAAIEGKLLGWYARHHFPGQRVGVLYQDDSSGRAALAGVRHEVSDVVAATPYRTGTTTLEAQVRALKRAKADVLINFTLPTYTAIEILASLRAHFSPRLLVWSGGSDPLTLARLVNLFSAGAFHGYGLVDGIITDSYLPPAGDTTNRWVRLFKRIATQYDPGVPFDSNVVYGMANAYTLVQALRAAGRNLTRQKLIQAIESQHSWAGPGLVPLRYTSQNHGGFTGAQMGRIVGARVVLFGRPLVTTSSPTSPVRSYLGHAADPPRAGIP